jgi:UPF0755 protein
MPPQKNYVSFLWLLHDFKRWIAVATLAVIILIGIFIIPPYNFPSGISVDIKDGLTLSQTAELLAKENLIKSQALFKTMIFLIGGERAVRSGEYFFAKPANAGNLAYRIARGNFGFEAVKITFPEGSTLAEISSISGKKLSKFNSEEFAILTHGKEGFLFPDTYVFYTNTKTTDVIKALDENFKNKTAEIRRSAEKLGKDFRDIVIMASIIEEEARTAEDRRLISGILWKRIKIGMPLQVDAPFIYSTGKNTYQLTLKDLKTASPYNTYQNRGLPAGPISNPGLDSLDAALYPKDSPYLFYLSGKDGTVYYGKDFAEHKKNKELYL